MDSRTFDTLTRLLGRRLPRRGAITAALGLATGATLVGDAAADSRRTYCRTLRAACTRDSHCCSGVCDTSATQHRTRRNRCVCPDGLATCGSACIDLDTDTRHCGACGNACANGTCVNGVCLSLGPCASAPGDPFDYCVHTVEGEDFDLACGGNEFFLALQNPDAFACTSSSQCADRYQSCADPDIECVCSSGGWSLDGGDGPFVWTDWGFVDNAICVPFTRNADLCIQ